MHRLILHARLPQAPARTGLQRLADAMRALIGALRRSLCAARTRRALGQVSDHTLKDIGLHRSEIPSVAAGDLDRLNHDLAAAGDRTDPTQARPERRH